MILGVALEEFLPSRQAEPRVCRHVDAGSCARDARLPGAFGARGIYIMRIK